MKTDLWYDQRCPLCGSAHLTVVVEMWAVLTEDGSDVYHDDCIDHDQTWDDSSMMLCLDCEHDGTAGTFTPKEKT